MHNDLERGRRGDDEPATALNARRHTLSSRPLVNHSRRRGTGTVPSKVDSDSSSGSGALAGVSSASVLGYTNSSSSESSCIGGESETGDGVVLATLE